MSTTPDSAGSGQVVDEFLRSTAINRDDYSCYLAPYITLLACGSDAAAELETLRVHRDPGTNPIIRSRGPWNVIVQWTKLVKASVKTAGGVMTAVAGGPVGALVGIGLALSTLPDLFDLPTIDLSETHSRVVIYLWADREGDQAVPQDDVATHFAAQLGHDELETVLNDLTRLRIIRRDGDVVVKRDLLVGNR